MQDYISISSENEENSLTHHGVKGMKWGVRKQRKSSSGSTKTKKNGKSKRYTKYNTLYKESKNKARIRSLGSMALGVGVRVATLSAATALGAAAMPAVLASYGAWGATYATAYRISGGASYNKQAKTYKKLRNSSKK